jgi:hypothetical protein
MVAEQVQAVPAHEDGSDVGEGGGDGQVCIATSLRTRIPRKQEAGRTGPPTKASVQSSLPVASAVASTSSGSIQSQARAGRQAQADGGRLHS